VTVVLEEFVRPDGITSNIFLTTTPEVVAECKAYKMAPTTLEDRKTLEHVLGLVMGEPALFIALNDLIHAITVPNMVPGNCGRVVDAIRKLVAPALEPKPGWQVFRETLNFDEAYTTFISEHSKKPRHGELVRIERDATTEILRRTWAIMNRLLEYRKRGNQPLPLAEFPVLKG
jgi:hypothetical protein